MQEKRNIVGRARRIVGRRQVRYGTNATIMTIAFIAILILLNIVAERNHVRWDLTEEGRFSLSPETLTIIENLEQPVEIIGFFTEQSRPMQEDVESRLQEYTSRSELIRYRSVDPQVDPLAARNYEITSDNTLVFVSGEQQHQLTGIKDEQALTRALLNVTDDTPTTVYFLTGHGERSMEGFAPTDYSEASRLLQEDNVPVMSISLLVSDTIPLEHSVLIIADPQRELQERETAAIARYLMGGGRVMLLSNPFSPLPLPEVLEAAGLAWNDDLLIDAIAEVNRPYNPVVMSYPPHPITNALDGPTLFATVRTIVRTEQPAGLTSTVLLESSQDSQAVTNFDEQNIELTEGDAQGPLPFGFTLEGTITPTITLTDTAEAARAGSARMVVLGDADFASNEFVTLPNTINSVFFRSAVAWLAADEEGFTLPPRPEPADRTVLLTEQQSNLVFLGTTLAMPLLVILIGVVVWWQRR
jgi:ABC-type uncharacterized transport system involved in gliding motility auxiliary subunit